MPLWKPPKSHCSWTALRLNNEGVVMMAVMPMLMRAPPRPTWCHSIYDEVAKWLRFVARADTVWRRGRWKRCPTWRHRIPLYLSRTQHEGGLGDPGHEAFEMHNSLPGHFAVEFLNFPQLSKKGLEACRANSV